MGKGLDISPRRYTSDQQAHKKIFGIIGHEENANQKHKVTTLQPLGWL